MTALLDRFRTRQAFRWEFTERRALPRIPVGMPVRLRIGPALYEESTKKSGVSGYLSRIL
jgi:hypothetical protein